MWFTNILVVWATILTLASAFHPYFPAYRCTDDGDCLHVSKRAIQGSVRENQDDSITFELKQHIPDVETSEDVKIRSTIDHLVRKYSMKATEDADLDKRTNNYTVLTSTTPTEANSAAIDQDGTDFSYFAVVNFGSKATPLYMLLDTGASSTWVMGSSCSSSVCQEHNTFGSSDSDTYTQTSQSFSVAYGTGDVSGSYASDTLSFAGFNLKMTFGVANTTSDEFSSYPMDGIMGLARTSQEVPTFIQVLSDAKVVQSNIFGVNLNRASDDSNDGEITFGAADTSKYSGSLGFTPLTNTNGDWVITADDLGINNKQLGVTGRPVYIDTGTSYIFMPPADAKTLHESIPGSSASSDGTTWYVPCSTTTAIQFFFSGVGYSVSSEDWVGGKANNLCTSNIYGVDVVGSGAWLLGDTFLKNVYAVFDSDQNRIGFASKLTASTSSTESSSTGSGSSSTISKSSSPSTTLSSSSTTATSETPEPFNAHASSTATESAATGSQSSTAASAASLRIPAANLFISCYQLYTVVFPILTLIVYLAV